MKYFNGFSLQNEEKVFDEFHQIENTFTKKYDGTGLGLSLVKQFVALHAGELSLESTIGKGSRFTFSIPKKAHVPLVH